MFLLGCQGGSGDWVGTYKGQRTAPNADALPEELRTPYLATKLEIKPDMKFILTVGGIPYAGTAEKSADGLSLKILTVVEKPTREPKTLPAKWATPGQSITVPDPTETSTKEIVVERVAEKN